MDSGLEMASLEKGFEMEAFFFSRAAALGEDGTEDFFPAAPPFAPPEEGRGEKGSAGESEGVGVLETALGLAGNGGGGPLIRTGEGAAIGMTEEGIWDEGDEM